MIQTYAPTYYLLHIITIHEHISVGVVHIFVYAFKIIVKLNDLLKIKIKTFQKNINDKIPNFFRKC